MDIGTFLIADAQASPVEEPVEACFDDVAVLAEPAIVFGVASSDKGLDTTFAERFADLFLGVVGAIREKFVRSTSRASSRLFDGRNRVNQRDRHLRIVTIRAGVGDCQRRPVGVGQQVTLRAGLAPIRGIGPRFRPPKTARTEQLSIADVDQSIWSAKPSSSKRTCQTLCHTPAACQSRSRRQQVIPLPQSNSWGRYSQGHPVLATNRIPVKHARSGTRGRPPFGLGGSGGKSGSIRSHNASGNSGLAMPSSLTSPLTNHVVREV